VRILADADHPRDVVVQLREQAARPRIDHCADRFRAGADDVVIGSPIWRAATAAPRREITDA